MSCATPCDCCAALPAAVAAGSVPNLPGRDALSYRIGTHGSFLAAMLARLTTHELPDGRRPLAGLRSRDRSDPAIALLDAWAVVADVLAFYQERIASEGYVRTAVERRSLLELGQLVGYQMRPAVAATAHLAFTLTRDPRSDVRVVIPAGTRAQSVPGPGERPQPFETSVPLDARESLGILLPRTLRPQQITAATAATMDALRVEGAAADLKAGDRVLFDFAKKDAPGSEVANMDAPEGEQVVRIVSAVVADPPRTPEQPTGQEAPASLLPPPLRATIMFQAVKPPATEHPSRAFQLGFRRPLPLGGLLETLRRPPSVSPRSGALLARDPDVIFGGPTDLTPQLLGALRPRLGDALYASLGGAQFTTSPTLRRIVAMQRAAPFGAAAPKWVPPQGSTGFSAPQEWTVAGNDLYKEVIQVPGLKDASSVQPTAAVADAADPAAVAAPAAPAGPGPHELSAISLDREYPTVLSGDWAVIEGSPVQPAAPPLVTRIASAARAGVSAYQVSGTVTKLHLETAWLKSVPAKTSLQEIREVSVYVPLRDLVAAPESDDSPVEKAEIVLDGVYQGLVSGRSVIVAGERVDLADGAGVNDGELAMIASVEHTVNPELAGDLVHTVIHLAAPLGFVYRRSTTKIYANVVRSTQGESVSEVLGGGDPARALQRLSLSRKPVTYLPAATAFGATGTLKLRVDDLLWHEARGLARMGPTERGYLVGIADDDTESVTFGTGERGARPPAGVDNVRAAYRVGAGATGNLGAGRISQLVTRPAGVNAVLNPLVSSGGADRDGLQSARENIPISVEALERLVSVRDFEDFARARAGIGKASARLLSDGRRRFVHLTIAGVDDAPVTPSSDLFVALRDAIAACGDPHMPFVVGVRLLALIVLVVDVAIDDDRDWTVVERVARAALLDAFSVQRRQLGEDVLLSQVVAAVQRVPGVRWVDVAGMTLVPEDATTDALNDLPKSLSKPPPARLPVALASTHPGAKKGDPPVIAPAQLALLSPKVPDTLILRQVAP